MQLPKYQAVIFSNNDGVHALVDPASKINVQTFYGPHGTNQPRVDLKHDAEGLVLGTATRRIFNGLAGPKAFLDAFFAFRESPRGDTGVTILLTMDEATSTKILDGEMGADHPLEIHDGSAWEVEIREIQGQVLSAYHGQGAKHLS